MSDKPGDKAKEPTKADIEAAQMRQAHVGAMISEQSTQLEILAHLRSTRAARGDNAPLKVPAHLRETAAIIITDRDVEDAFKNR